MDGRGLHFIEDDLEEFDPGFDVEEAYTAWLWPDILYALMWDVPKT